MQESNTVITESSVTKNKENMNRKEQVEQDENETKKRKKHLSDEVKKIALDCIAKNQSHVDVADVLGINVRTLYRWVKEAKQKEHPVTPIQKTRNNKIRSEDVQKLLELCKADEKRTYIELWLLMGKKISRSSISRFLNQHNIRRKVRTVKKKH